MPDDASASRPSSLLGRTPAAHAAPYRALGLAALLGFAGVTHFARPRVFEPLIPRALGNPRAWVLVSGVAELACAAAVAVPRTRRGGALASAALFVAVFPGNVQMALDSRGATDPTRTTITWARLPLQVPLIGWALAVSRRSVSPSRDAAAP